MFTGIVEEMGFVQALLPTVKGGWDLTVQARIVLGGTVLGDSIAVNGTCLTVTAYGEDWFTVGLAPETLRCTNLGALQHADSVNLERSLLPTTRLGGHFVQGHVDEVGTIVARRVENDSLWLTISASPSALRYIVPKGYIAVDGASLTVVDVTEHDFSLMLIAYTQQKIGLAQKAVGSLVNLEVDILGKYVEKSSRSWAVQLLKNTGGAL